jgi:hypothetical protein
MLSGLARGMATETPGPATGRILPVSLKQVTVTTLYKDGWASGFVLATVDQGTKWDWAVTAMALGDAVVATGEVDFVKVQVQDAAIPEGEGDMFKDLATLYYGNHPARSPWPDKPWQLFTVEARTTPRELEIDRLFQREYDRQLSLRPGDLDKADRLASRIVEKTFKLKPGWHLPLGHSTGGYGIGRDQIVAQGSLDNGTLSRIKTCLSDRRGRGTWGCRPGS